MKKTLLTANRRNKNRTWNWIKTTKRRN